MMWPSGSLTAAGAAAVAPGAAAAVGVAAGAAIIAGATVLAADPDRLFTFVDLDLGDVGFLEKFDQFFDFADIHKDFSLIRVVSA